MAVVALVNVGQTHTRPPNRSRTSLPRHRRHRSELQTPVVPRQFFLAIVCDSRPRLLRLNRPLCMPRADGTAEEPPCPHHTTTTYARTHTTPQHTHMRTHAHMLPSDRLRQTGHDRIRYGRTGPWQLSSVHVVLVLTIRHRRPWLDRVDLREPPSGSLPAQL